MDSGITHKIDPKYDPLVRKSSFEEVQKKINEALLQFGKCLTSLEQNISNCHSIIEEMNKQSGIFDTIINRPKKNKAIQLSNSNIEISRECQNLCRHRQNQLIEFQGAYARLLQYLDKVFIHWQFFRDTAILGDGIDMTAIQQIQFCAQVLKTASDVAKLLGFLVFIASGGMFGGVIAAGLGIFDLIMDLISALFNIAKLNELNSNLTLNIMQTFLLNTQLKYDNEIDIFNKKMQQLLFEAKYIQSTGISEHEMWEALIKASAELNEYSGRLELFNNFAEEAKTPQEVKKFAEKTSQDVANEEERVKMIKMLFFSFYRKSNTEISQIARYGDEVGTHFSAQDLSQIAASDAIMQGEDPSTVQQKFGLSDPQIALIRKIVLP
ncbi:hypothetical protein FGO68_gene33 [Halteria grandinella]|uniref:Uncharacterized protein n=1 Tax=Halteria grandinella TaxID=5974 RepID=A0A8J8T8S2_HALGN|nr:hypothetical protein FGO68_gene33 [Halteria grandinella]